MELVKFAVQTGSRMPGLHGSRRTTHACHACLCREESAGFKQHQRRQQQQELLGGGSAAAAVAGAADSDADGRNGSADGASSSGVSSSSRSGSGSIRLAIDCAAVVLFECRSLERLLSFQPIVFQGACHDLGWPGFPFLVLVSFVPFCSFFVAACLQLCLPGQGAS